MQDCCVCERLFFPIEPNLMCLSYEAWWLAQQPAHSLFVLFWIKSRGLQSSRTNRAPYVPARLPNWSAVFCFFLPDSHGTDDEDRRGSIKHSSHVSNVEEEGRTNRQIAAWVQHMDPGCCSRESSRSWIHLWLPHFTDRTLLHICVTRVTCARSW